MSWPLFRAAFHQRRTAIFWYCVSLVLYAWMTMWFWGEMGPTLAKMMESYPKEVLVLFGGDKVPFASAGGFMQVEFLGLMWIIIIASAVLVFAVRAFASDIGSGTMELVLAQPVSRVRVAVTRIVALVVYVLALNLATFLPLRLLGPTYDIDLGWEGFLVLFALGTLFSLAIGGLGMAFSAMFRDGGKPVAITSGILLVFWLADMIANVSEAAEVLDPVNLVTYWQPGIVINGGDIESAAWWIYAAVALVGLAGSVAVFARRDVA
jgi:ABC-2 type transport system permease protein